MSAVEAVGAEGVEYAASTEEAVERVIARAEEGDVILTQGAGSVSGIAPLVLGLFFLGSVQMLFLGIIGEYIGSIYTQVMHRPLVVEKERINFDEQIPKSDVTG